MSLLCLPCGKLPLAFLTVPAGKDGRVECPCQTVDDFIGVGGSICGLFLFVQMHAPLTIRRQFIRTKKKKHANACSPVDIPTGWEPRTKQQPTGLIAYPAAQGRAVQVLLSAPDKKDPNLFSIGEGFGFFVFFGKQDEGSFPMAVCPKPYQKNRITKVTTVKVP